MNRSTWQFPALLILVVLAAPASAGLVEPDAHPAGTDISALYAGVTLSDEGFASANGVFSVVGLYPSTGSRVFGPDSLTSGLWAELFYVLRADFDALVSNVAIDVIVNDPSDSGFLRAYNSSGTLIGEHITLDGLPTGTVTTAFVNRPAGDIAYIRASGTNGDTVLLDNLRFTPIPEPATLVLLGAGLVSLAALRRRRRARRT